MSFLVDTCVWSLALRRDHAAESPEVKVLRIALESGETLVTTGLILQELLQGFSGPRAREKLLAHFSALPLLSPARSDHVEAAGLRNRCRRAGVQVGTIDALIAQLCIRYEITLLTVDRDFHFIARHSQLRVWSSANAAL